MPTGNLDRQQATAALPARRARRCDSGKGYEVFVPAFAWSGLIEAGKFRKLAALTGGNAAAFNCATAAHADTEKAFRVRNVFIPFRTDPYPRATTLKHPECAGKPESLASRTASTRKALVHGNLSLQNNLIGQSRPDFFDTDCARFGDAAFYPDRRCPKCISPPYRTGNYLACCGANDAGMSTAGEHRNNS